jgi:LemA protein
LVIGALAAGVAIWAVLAYNRLIALRAGFRNAFAQIEVQLRRRFDLVPNLVAVARKYMEHERATLESVIVARNLASHATQRASQAPGDVAAMQGLSQAAGMLSDSIGRLMVVAEAYPELKADARMAALSEELASTENRIAFARQAYNDSVMDYNVAIGVFPVNLLAALFGFPPSRQLNAAEIPAQREPVRVQF